MSPSILNPLSENDIDEIVAAFKLLGGYLPDGQGLHYGINSVKYNETVTADDDLVLYLT